jgi:hypothetical protein
MKVAVDLVRVVQDGDVIHRTRLLSSYSIVTRTRVISCLARLTQKARYQ